MYTHARPSPQQQLMFFTPYDKPRTQQNYSDFNDVQSSNLSTFGNQSDKHDMMDLINGVSHSHSYDDDENGPRLSEGMLANFDSSNNSNKNHTGWVQDRVAMMASSQQQRAYHFNLNNINSPPRPPPHPPVQPRPTSRPNSNTNAKSNTHADSTIHRLKELQLSCVQSMATLRVIKSEVLQDNDSISASMTPLQQTITLQAAKIATLQEKLSRAEEIYSFLPAQQTYIIELESTLAFLETNLNETQKQQETYSDGYTTQIKEIEKLKLEISELQKKVASQQVEQKMEKQQLRELQSRIVQQSIFRWNKKLINKIFVSWQTWGRKSANYKNVVRKFKSKMLNGTVFRCFKSWSAMLASIHSERRILTKLKVSERSERALMKTRLERRIPRN